MNPSNTSSGTLIAESAAAVVSAIGGAGGVVALIKSRADRNKIISDTAKNKVEAVAILSATAIELVNSMRTQITDLETRIADLETRVMAAESRAVTAETRLQQMGRT
ncbi:MAG: hypothetical protein ACRDQ4_11360 [Pseudonocardiaceae bacterium]